MGRAMKAKQTCLRELPTQKETTRLHTPLQSSIHPCLVHHTTFVLHPPVCSRRNPLPVTVNGCGSPISAPLTLRIPAKQTRP